MTEKQSDLDWELVELAFYEDSEECHNCQHWFYQYYTDTGHETSCALLDSGSGIATDCPAFDRMKDERENQNDPF